VSPCATNLPNFTVVSTADVRARRINLQGSLDVFKPRMGPQRSGAKSIPNSSLGSGGTDRGGAGKIRRARADARGTDDGGIGKIRSARADARGTDDGGIGVDSPRTG
jgi:hypothetical protein